MKDRQYFKNFSIISISLWLAFFVAFSFIIIITVSFLQKDPDQLISWHFTFENYLQLLDPLYLRILLDSFLLAATVTLICFLLGFPFAYFMLQLSPRQRATIILLLIIPFWTSSLIRSYALIAILKAHGVINSLLITIGLIDTPLPILFSNTAVLIGLVYNLLPFMIFPIYAKLERLNPQLIHAARDLGANQWTIITKIIMPLALPGIMAGVFLVFLPAMTLFYIPDLLGGADSILLGNLIQFQFVTAYNWPGGAATSILLTFMVVMLIMLNLCITPKQSS